MTRQAAALQVRTCIPEVPSFAQLVHHVHLTCLDRVGRASAGLIISERLLVRLQKSAANVLACRAIGGLRVTIELPAIPAARPHMGDERDVPQATAIRLFACARGWLHIELVGVDGGPFATASFTADNFSRFIGEGCDLLEIVSNGGLATMPCEGAA